MKRILLVDDNVTTLRQISTQLSGSYDLSLVKSGREALQFCGSEKPALILLDVEMPGMDGFETITKLKEIPGMDVPVIFLTGNVDEETELRALRLGARDFILKPVDKNILLHRVVLHLQLHEFHTNLRSVIRELENNIVVSFAEIIECRDSNTGKHVLRTQKYVGLIGRELIARGQFADELSEETLELMARGAPFHDIGKIGVSDVVLCKPSALTGEEYEEVKRHSRIGGRVLSKIGEHIPAQRYHDYAKIMAEGHHERFDGTGYPNGVRGCDIPLCCRLLAVANVYDGCVTDRTYRPALSHDEACEIIEKGAGSEFDPVIVDAFRAIRDRLDEPFEPRPERLVTPEDVPGSGPKEILAVDDNVVNLKQIGSCLAGRYEYTLVTSGAEALSFCVRNRPDLILLDLEMPEMDGFETIDKLKKSPALSDIPVIFLTAHGDVATEVRGFQSGAMDFIKKPVSKSILLHRIELHLRLSSWQSHLVETVRGMSDNLAASIADLIECRDENTGGHVVRTGRYVEMLGRELRTQDLFMDELSDTALDMMVRSAPLHDIGKISISDRILLKPGRLNDKEFAAMKTHSTIGAEILTNMYRRTPAQRYLEYASMIASSHHERFDGGGYPWGLSGNAIPLCGRIMAVADVYDALVSDRVYRGAMSRADAFRIIMDGRGTWFDPHVTDAFAACYPKFVETPLSRP
ncbi:MAG: response regulator [Synergistaceae bacterium]|jgi:putative two-component system response regulator|nr:response regulator [Synergistaceae bacterium]